MNYSEIKCKRISLGSEGEMRRIDINKRGVVCPFPLHWHECFEIELVIDGKMTQIINGKTYELSCGDIYLLDPTDFHEIISADGAVIYNLMFSEDLPDDTFTERLLSSKENAVFHLEKKEFESVSFILSEILRESEEKQSFSEDYIKNLVECLFITISRKFSSVPSDTFRHENGISKALLMIHARFRENPTMVEIAERASLNPSYFSALFHKSVGKTYKQYISELKLNYSKKLLFSSNLSITEICFACGYNSLSNFLREFRKFFGITPAEMRKGKKTAD